MKYLGPLIVGIALTLGALWAVQAYWVPPPGTEPRPAEEAAIDPALLSADLTVRNRPAPREIAPEDLAAVRAIDAPRPSAPAETVVAEAPPPGPAPVTEPAAPIDAAEAAADEGGSLVDGIAALLAGAAGDDPAAEPVAAAGTGEAPAEPDPVEADVAAGEIAVESAPEAVAVEPAPVEVAAAAPADDAAATAAAPLPPARPGSADPALPEPDPVAVASLPEADPAAEPEAALESRIDDTFEALDGLDEAIAILAPPAADEPQAGPAQAAAPVEADASVDAAPSAASGAPGEPAAPAEVAEAPAAEPAAPAEVAEAPAAEPPPVEAAAVEPGQPQPPAPPAPAPVQPVAPPVEPTPIPVATAGTESEPAPAARPARQPAVETAAAPAAAPPAEPADPGALVFPGVSVLDAGSFRGIRNTRPVIVRIAGVEALPFAERCGQGWHCGGLARAELARMIGGQAVTCTEQADVTGSGKVREVLASCRAGERDLAEWLVENGWGRPVAGGDPRLADVARAAEAARRGQYAAASPAQSASN